MIGCFQRREELKGKAVDFKDIVLLYTQTMPLTREKLV